MVVGFLSDCIWGAKVLLWGCKKPSGAKITKEPHGRKLKVKSNGRRRLVTKYATKIHNKKAEEEARPVGGKKKRNVYQEDDLGG